MDRRFLVAAKVDKMVEWLDENVQKEYVVMKVEAKVMEQVVKGWWAGIWYNCINEREPEETDWDRD